MNDTLLALDFISLLLSKHSPAAQTTMSPFLKENVPPATLEGRLFKHAEPTTTTKRHLDTVCRSWKTKSFESASAKILAASSRLEGEANRDSLFWEQIAEIQHQGWSVSRRPGDSREIGVHYGFVESNPKFRNRGFALLRQDKDGNINLERPNTGNKTAQVQVRVSRTGNVTGSSTLSATVMSPEIPILQQIEASRDALFEEELFYEVGREGRSVANQGVTISSDTVDIKIDSEVHLQVVTLLQTEHIAPSNSDQTDHILAEACALALKVLLVEAHRNNYQRRSHPPMPLSLQPKFAIEYPLLRPIMSHLQHQLILQALERFFDIVTGVMISAGLSLSIDLERSLTDRKFSLDVLLSQAESSFNITLPSSRILSVTIRSKAAPPIYGTDFSASSVSYSFGEMNFPVMNSMSECFEFFCNALVIDIVAYIAEKLSLRLSGHRKGAKEFTATPKSDIAILDPREGEISVEVAGRSSARIYVQVRPNRFGLRLHLRHSLDGAKTLVYTWVQSKSWRVPSYGSEPSATQQLPEVLDDLSSHIMSQLSSP